MRLPEQTLTTHVSSHVEEEIRTRIDQSALVHLMTVLTDLYSNPMLAVIREYSTNAIDSHIEAGVKDPIEIGLPSSFNPSFTVTDHGLGLSLDDLRDRYSMYGHSSKRESDEVNGMLGLGCKSGLTYALNFSVTAIKGGVKTVAAVTKDADGVGVFKILDTVSTTEHNGVQISIPVKSLDIDRFRTEAEAFYSYWKPGTVKIDGRAPKFILAQEPEKVLWLDDDICVVIGRNGYSHVNESKIVMGNVAYPVPSKLVNRSSSLPTYGRQPQPKQTYDRQFVAWVPIGAVNFTPSREALHETRQTKETIAAVQEYIDDHFGAALEARLATIKEPFEKMLFLNQWQFDPVVRSKQIGMSVQRTVTPTRTCFTWDGYSSSKVDGQLAAPQFMPRSKYVVYNFPFKGVSVLHKERFKAYGIEKCIIIPDGTDLSPIKGRENQVDWDTIVEETAKPNMPKSLNARVRVKTLYRFWYQGTQHTAEDLNGKQEICYAVTHSPPNQHLYPEVKCAEITSQQVDRFMRLHPTATSMSQYHSKQCELARKALTEADKIRWTTPQGKSLKEFKPDDFLDPDLKEVCEAQQGPISLALQRAVSLGAVKMLQPHGIHAILDDRYPIFERMGTIVWRQFNRELLVYLNAKYLTLKPANESK